MPKRLEILENSGSLPAGAGQKAVATDWQHRFIGAQGGWMSGKTWVGARKLVTLHLYNAFDDFGEATFVPSVCVAPTYSNALDFDVPALQDALDEAGLTWQWRSSGGIAQGRFAAPAFVLEDLGTRRFPSVILVRTAQQPRRITGWEAGAGWGDEPARWPEDRNDPQNDPLTQLVGRVRHPMARFIQLLFTYTNEGDITRIYEMFHGGRPDHVIYTLPTRENPLAQNFYNQQVKLLPPDLVRQYLEGEAINLRGAKVYSLFDPGLHVDERLALSKDLPLHLSLDFNIAPGMHAELGQYWPSQDLFVVIYEIFASRLDTYGVVQHLAHLLDGLGGWSWTEPLQIFGDATGRAENAATGESCYAVLTQGLQEKNIPYRVRVPKANPPEIDRINAYNASLLDQTSGVHWKCHPRCQQLIQDLRDLKRGIDGKVDKSERSRSHASDAEGYRISYLRPVRIRGQRPQARFSVQVGGYPSVAEES